jgi:hypothetical protein
MLEPVEPRFLLAAFTVTSSADVGSGSLRAVLQQVNDDDTPGVDTVDFQIETGPQTISLGTALPSVARPVLIDGTSQPGYEGTPLIEILGSNGSAQDGLTLGAGSDGSTIKGLQIDGFTLGADIKLDSGSNSIQGNELGKEDTLVNGVLVHAAGSHVGVSILSSNNTIGGGVPVTRNIISGGNAIGVDIEGQFARHNSVGGNYIGTDPTGLFENFRSLGNDKGIVIGPDASANTIGGSVQAAGNLISFNQTGLDIQGAMNSVEGNLIGTDLTGETTVTRTLGIGLGNNVGILIEGDRGYANVIGGVFVSYDAIDGLATTPGLRNVISGNFSYGVEISGRDNVVQGNDIGTNADGTSTLNSPTPRFLFQDSTGNGTGVVVDGGGVYNTIGGTISAETNIISGNRFAGVHILGTAASNDVQGKNVVEGNDIGTDSSGKAAQNRDGSSFGNGFGILLEGKTGFTQIGGSTQGARNIIMSSIADGIEVSNDIEVSNINPALNEPVIQGDFIGASQGSGIHLSGFGVSATVVGNMIGMSVDGQLAPNSDGVRIDGGAEGNLIGGFLGFDSNTIVGSSNAGVEIIGIDTVNNFIEGNFIGTDPSANSLGNAVGVLLNGTSGNVIGNSDGGGPLPYPYSGNQANVIGCNGVGIEFEVNNPFFGNGNSIEGNLIGVTKAAGGQPVSNQYGIWIDDVTLVTIGGTAEGQGNEIADNTKAGVYISGVDASGNQIEGNSILGPVIRSSVGKGTRTNPTNPFPIGVFIENASSNTIGGTGAGQGNTISGNNVGVYIVGSGGSSTNNQILGNQIGVAANGGPDPGNVLYGVIFVNAPDNSAPESGPGANRIVGSGIANFREYSGPIQTSTSPTTGGSGTAARKPAHHSSHVPHRSARHTTPRAHGAIHGRVVPAGPLHRNAGSASSG